MGLAWKMKVRFSGKLLPHEHVTEDIRFRNPGWGDEVFNRQIDSLEFFLPTGHRILMSGMAAYNFFVEATQSMSGGSARIQAFWFLGRLPGSDVVEMWRVGEGKVVRQRKTFGTEWGGTPTSGWKNGTPGSAVSAIMEG